MKIMNFFYGNEKLNYNSEIKIGKIERYFFIVEDSNLTKIVMLKSLSRK